MDQNNNTLLNKPLMDIHTKNPITLKWLNLNVEVLDNVK